MRVPIKPNPRQSPRAPRTASMAAQAGMLVPAGARVPMPPAGPLPTPPLPPTGGFVGRVVVPGMNVGVGAGGSVGPVAVFIEAFGSQGGIFVGYAGAGPPLPIVTWVTRQTGGPWPSLTVG